MADVKRGREEEGEAAMLKFRAIGTMAAAGLIAVGCARGMEGSAGGDVIDPAEAAKTVVLHVMNQNSEPMELRTVSNGQSRFVGSVGAMDSTSILLDPSLMPAGFLYVVGIPASGRGRAIAGPLSASKGDRIDFHIMPVLDMSHAMVIR